jgi:transcriptional regulator with XRE-family HTH domain
LVQFDTAAHTCRRCKTSLDPEPPAPDVAPAPTPAALTPVTLGQTIRDLRLRAGLSQRELAARLRTPRTYVSKMELERCTPTLGNVVRVAAALGLSAFGLFVEHERRQHENHGHGGLRSELLADPWIRALAPFVGSLSQVQRRTLLAEVADMSQRRRAEAA